MKDKALTALEASQYVVWHPPLDALLEKLARAGYANTRKRPAFEFKMLENSVAYIAIDHFESDASIKAFEKALPQIMRARGLVIDVRQNGGGSTEFGHQILRHLTIKPIRGAASFIRMEDGLNRAQLGSHVRSICSSAASSPARRPVGAPANR